MSNTMKYIEEFKKLAQTYYDSGDDKYYWDGIDFAEGYFSQSINTAVEEREKEIKEKITKTIRPYFANEAIVCTKCNHFADSHYWNGGGRVENSGYDSCRVCDCVDYDEDKDFQTKILDYNENAIKDILNSIFPK